MQARLSADTSLSYNSSTGANGDGKTPAKSFGLWIAAAQRQAA